jgi:6-phosphofructokinase 1
VGQLRIFLSYNFEDQAFVREVVQRVGYYLRKQKEVEIYLWSEAKAGEWVEQLKTALNYCNAGVAFISSTIGETQKREIEALSELKDTIVATIVPDRELPGTHIRMVDWSAWTRVTYEECRGDPAVYAKEILRALRLDWVTPDGLPIGYLFDYERDIIKEYRKGRGRISDSFVRRGAPTVWPWVHRDEAELRNPILQGSWRGRAFDGEAIDCVVVDAHMPRGAKKGLGAAPPPEELLVFREAGAAEDMVRYNGDVRAAVIVCGGIAPGVNAVISGIVRRHADYARPAQPHVWGYDEGLKSLVGFGPHRRIPLDVEMLRPYDGRGGSIIATSRTDELMEPDPVRRDRALMNVIHALRVDGVQILYVIGGDGGMRAAHALWTRARAHGYDLSVIGIPKTMDNDILWVWQSFGFLSAVEKAKEAVLELHTEVTSNPRLCIIQLFGSDSGFVVSHAALASGVCDAVLMPEMDADISLEGLSHYICGKLRARRAADASPHGIILMAESFIPSDISRYRHSSALGLTSREQKAIESYLEHGRRVVGQTPDELRSAGLKVMRAILERDVRAMSQDDPYWTSYRVLCNEPRHLIRAIPPSVADVIFAQRLGVLAVDNSMAGYTDFMISQWLTEYVLVPLDLVVLGRKRMPHGFFWRAVLDNTQQPTRMPRSTRVPADPAERTVRGTRESRRTG